jgi:hypothetical protein
MNIPLIPAAFDPTSKGLMYPVTMAACTVAAVFQSNHTMLLADNTFMFVIKFIWNSAWIGVVDITVSLGIWMLFLLFSQKELAAALAGIIAIPLLTFAWLAFTKNNILPETCLNTFWAITAALHAFLFITFTEGFIDKSDDKKEIKSLRIEKDK